MRMTREKEAVLHDLGQESGARKKPAQAFPCGFRRFFVYKIMVSPWWKTVKAGEKIGEVSTTASYEFSDGAHLHLEISKNGTAVDPMPYVKGEVYREVEQVKQ